MMPLSFMYYNLESWTLKLKVYVYWVQTYYSLNIDVDGHLLLLLFAHYL
jgi:hypothetical protein